jgi:cytochrome c-type biogenesis protein CcmH
MNKKHLLFVLILVCANFPLSINAVEPNEILKNPQLEMRARMLSKNIRCLVCQNQSIDDSNASLAKDLRRIVREQLVNGASDNEIFDFLVKRYGDFVLLKPPIKPTTYILWYGPLFLFIIGIFASILFLSRRKKILPEPPLTNEEIEKLSKLTVNRNKN